MLKCLSSLCRPRTVDSRVPDLRPVAAKKQTSLKLWDLGCVVRVTAKSHYPVRVDRRYR